MKTPDAASGMLARSDPPAARECRYCGDDAVGEDALGRPACKRHIEEVADDAPAASGYRWLGFAMLAWTVGLFDGWRIFG